jgi:hypothetical protein
MKYQCNVCGAQKDLPEHASDFFVNGQPVCLSPSLTTPGVCRGKLEPMPIWSKGMKFTCVTCGVDTIQSERAIRICRSPLDSDLPGAFCGGILVPSAGKPLGEFEEFKKWISSHAGPRNPVTDPSPAMAELYPDYFRDVSQLKEIDVYMVHGLFRVKDDTGCLHHASKKLLLSGQRNGKKTLRQDVKEARDTLTRWLQIDEILSK